MLSRYPTDRLLALASSELLLVEDGSPRDAVADTAPLAWSSDVISPHPDTEHTRRQIPQLRAPCLAFVTASVARSGGIRAALWWRVEPMQTGRGCELTPRVLRLGQTVRDGADRGRQVDQAAVTADDLDGSEADERQIAQTQPYRGRGRS